MIMYEYDNDGVFSEREATPEEEAAITAFENEQKKPFNDLQTQIDDQNTTLDDVILMMADIIGGV